MSALTLGAHDRRGRGTAMQGHSPAAPRDERIDRDAVLWRPEGVGALTGLSQDRDCRLPRQKG